MRISDWSSDVCSSDLLAAAPATKKEKEEHVEVKQSAGAQQGGQSSQGNEIAAGYQTPSAIQLAAEPTESVQVSTDGCPRAEERRVGHECVRTGRTRWGRLT